MQTSIAIARECHLLHGSRRQVLVELAREQSGDCSNVPRFTFALLSAPRPAVSSLTLMASLPSITTRPARNCADLPADPIVKETHVNDEELESDVSLRDSGCCEHSVFATASSVGDGEGLEMGASPLDSESVELVLNGPTFEALQKHRPDLFQLVFYAALMFLGF